MKYLPLALLLFASPALAQQSLDPRIVPQAITVLQAQVSYLEAIIKAKDEDAAKLAAWWSDYLKGTMPSEK